MQFASVSELPALRPIVNTTNVKIVLSTALRLDLCCTLVLTKNARYSC